MKRLLVWLACVAFACVVFVSAGCGSAGSVTGGDAGASLEAGSPDAGGDQRSDSEAPTDAGSQADVPSLDLQSETDYPLMYYGGAEMPDPAGIVLVWYGDWSAEQDKQAIIERFIQELSGSSWLAVDQVLATDPWDGGVHVPPASHLTLLGSIDVGYLPPDEAGADLTDERIQKVVAAAPAGQNAIYVVLASPDVTMGGQNACFSYCAYHSSFDPEDAGRTGAGVTLKYAYVPDYEPYVPYDGGTIDTTCLDTCTILDYSTPYGVTNSPHGNFATDGMANALAHEIAETLVDPDPPFGWYDQLNYMENADKCAWRFDPVFYLPDVDGGAYANVTLNGEPWLLQQLWSNEPTGPNGGYCTLSAP